MKYQRFQALDGPHQGVDLPEGHRVYAIGDIHGRLDLLRELLAMVNADITDNGPSQNTIVFLGDYIDRGPDSAGVIAHLAELSVTDAANVFLLGNHEKYMIELVEDFMPVETWFQNGGKATLQSYGVDTEQFDEADDIVSIQRALKQNIPGPHWTFYKNLQTSWQLDGVFFAHAGVNPTRSLDQQREQDLIWIREKFLLSERDHGALIIHGHTPHHEPEVHRNRINVDTGAWQSDHLTAVVLENGQCRFLST